MLEVDVNIWAVLVAAVVYFMIGGFWYSVLFGKQWMELSGMTEEKIKESGSNVGTYATTFFLLLILSYVLAHMVAYIGATTLAESLLAGFWLWLGFVATTMLIDGLYADRRHKLTAINIGYHLVGIMAAAAILTVWA